MAKEKTVAECLAMVGPAETSFHSRWRLSSLRRVDVELYEALTDQQELYGSALVMGSDAEAKMQSEAMVRGWAAACKAMETVNAPDDAYLMGLDPVSGIQVVISEHKGSRDALAARYGEPLVLMTPSEVAALLGTVEIIRRAKECFPDAEIRTTTANTGVL